MPRITLGYGMFKGHTIPEVPDDVLKELARRFPLAVDKYDYSDSRSLLITVAVHQEVRRRESGGECKKRIPTLKELATDIVRSGFRHLSKTYHPDRSGASEAQRLLTEARDRLLNICGEMQEEYSDGEIVIEGLGPEISDEDIPF
jgi:hypothetical protein